VFRAAGEHCAQQGAGGFGAGAPVAGSVHIAQAGGDAGFPRQLEQRVEVGAYDDVGEPGVQAARDRDDIALGAGVVNGAAEGEAVRAGRGQLVEEYVPGTVGADEVGVCHPDHIDALGGQPIRELACF